MTPRLVAAFFLMLFGAGWCTIDLVQDNALDWHLGTGVAVMMAGAIFTDPKELVPAFKAVVDAIAQLLPFAKRKSTALPAVKDDP